jgi:uncharacterized protein YndB with AHSA1/START domain
VYRARVSTSSRRTCLAIADVSGYTGYLAGVELDHAQDILADLIGTVVDALLPFRLVKLEGDAAFTCLDGERVDGSLLQDTVEGTYVAFRRRLRDIRQASHCECNACVLIPRLDLKLVVHHGTAARHRIAGWEELVGSDVILVHRLLKNRVTESSGLTAYALYTQAAVDAAGIDPLAQGLLEHREETDVAGPVVTWLRDLEAHWREVESRPRREIPADPQRLSLEAVLPVPPQLAWEYITSPIRRPQWGSDITAVVENSPSGRRGPGTVNHCMHGRDAFVEEILEWRPPTYWLTRLTVPMPGHLQALLSDELEALPDGTTRIRSLAAPAEGTDRAAFEALRPTMRATLEAAVAILQRVLAEEAGRLARDRETLPDAPRSAGRHLSSPVVTDTAGGPGASEV